MGADEVAGTETPSLRGEGINPSTTGRWALEVLGSCSDSGLWKRIPARLRNKPLEAQVVGADKLPLVAKVSNTKTPHPNKRFPGAPESLVSKPRKMWAFARTTLAALQHGGCEEEAVAAQGEGASGNGSELPTICEERSSRAGKFEKTQFPLLMSTFGSKMRSGQFLSRLPQSVTVWRRLLGRRGDHAREVPWCAGVIPDL